MPFAVTWMDLETVILSEVSQTEKDKKHISLYVDSKKTLYKEAYLQNRNRLTALENKLMVAGWKDGGRDSQGVWDRHVYAAISKMDNQQGQGTLLNVMWISIYISPKKTYSWPKSTRKDAQHH